MSEIPFDKKSNVIIVYVDLLGSNKIIRSKMALDTGATYVMIPWEIAETLGLQPEMSKEKTEMITASGVEKAPIVTIKTMRVAGNEAKNVKAIVHDLPTKSYVDGLLGLSFLRNFCITLNFEEGIIELKKNNTP